MKTRRIFVLIVDDPAAPDTLDDTVWHEVLDYASEAYPGPVRGAELDTTGLIGQQIERWLCGP